MPPLTSLSGCGGCLCMSQKFSELEGRISMLYQIRDDEQMLPQQLRVNYTTLSRGWVSQPEQTTGPS
ncbi:hypothetical protein KUCAC02_014164 [Chaenocephalus aceratus]|uniref:Uncharacterized protein n=1 Tax=Chaenocephalus aceratus TaxID=36190 RepID=A0ACB9WES3_CHAAC|nr:hypothetical protein KUCAC02_014164 [Chaenocephalus aceratus]